MKKLLCIAPHLSTGGLPQYLLKKIQLIHAEYDITLVEYSDVTGGVLVVQRTQLLNLLGSNLITLGDDKSKLLDVISTLRPDIIHFEEIPEYFCDHNIAQSIYNTSRTYTIFETCHDSSVDIDAKIFLPDKFVLVSDFQVDMFRPLGIPSVVIDYPIYFTNRTHRTLYQSELGLDPTKKHVLNVGLFTHRKNQKEFFEYARHMPDVQFHSVGNMADNFRSYWEPLVVTKPPNVTIWGERSDVYKFYQAMDLLLFTSKGTISDKETMPLVLKEAVSNQIPICLYNLPVYRNFFKQFDNITYLSTLSFDDNINKIKKVLGLIDQYTSSHTFHTLNGVVDFGEFMYDNSMQNASDIYGFDAAMFWGQYVYNELSRGNISVSPGDVYVDFGSNIGMSCRVAQERGAASIYAFDPDPVMCELLSKNCPNATVFNYGISDTSYETTFYHWPYNEHMTGPQYTATLIDFKTALSYVPSDINYLKIDIEGSEENIFDSVTSYDMSRIQKMFIEHHYVDTTNDLSIKLQNLGFDVHIEYGNGQNYLYCYNSKFKSVRPRVAVAISTYTNRSYIINKTIETIQAVRAHTDYDVICTDHLPTPLEVIRLCDHYYYNPTNVLTTHTFFNRWFVNYPEFNIELNLHTSHNAMYHGPAVHQNIYAGVSVANMNSYDYVVLLNFDMTLTDADFKLIDSKISELRYSGKKSFFLYMDEQEGPTLKTVFFITDPSYYLDIASNIQSESDYDQLVNSVQSESNGLENLYYNLFKSNINDIIVENKSEVEFFNIVPGDGKTTSSQVEYSAILPVNNSTNDTNCVLLYKYQNTIDAMYKWQVYSNQAIILEHIIPAYVKSDNTNIIHIDAKFIQLNYDMVYDIHIVNTYDNSIIKSFNNVTQSNLNNYGYFNFK